MQDSLLDGEDIGALILDDDGSVATAASEAATTPTTASGGDGDLEGKWNRGEESNSGERGDIGADDAQALRPPPPARE